MVQSTPLPARSQIPPEASPLDARHDVLRLGFYATCSILYKEVLLSPQMSSKGPEEPSLVRLAPRTDEQIRDIGRLVVVWG